MPILLILGWIAFGLTALLAFLFLVTSILEREWRAAGLTVPLALLALGALGAPLIIDFPGRFWVILALLLLGALGVLLLTIPLGKSPPVQVSGPPERVDERDAVFHRFYRIRCFRCARSFGRFRSILIFRARSQIFCDCRSRLLWFFYFCEFDYRLFLFFRHSRQLSE